MSRRHAPPAAPFRRLLAVVCAAHVFALTLFAASPAAHEWLHAPEQSHECPHHGETKPTPTPLTSTPEHDCAVVLFAGGVDLPVGPIALLPPRIIPHGVSPVTAAEFYLVSPRYLRQPERGPPVSWVS